MARHMDSNGMLTCIPKNIKEVKQRGRQRQRERHKTIALHVRLHFRPLSRPLQNNVKLQNFMFSRKRERMTAYLFSFFLTLMPFIAV